MRDDLRMPVGNPMNDEGDVGKDTEESNDEAQKIDQQISDDPMVEEDGTSYDPATQAPKKAQQ